MNKDILIKKRCICTASIDKVLPVLCNLFDRKSVGADFLFNSNKTFFIVNKAVYAVSIDNNIYRGMARNKTKYYEITLKELKGLQNG